MLDIKWIRENQDAFLKGLTDRGSPGAPRNLESNPEPGRATPRHDSEIAGGAGPPQRRLEGDRPGQGGEGRGARQGADGGGGAAQSRHPATARRRSARTTKHSRIYLAAIPNVPADDVPVGDETANKELRKVGTPREIRLPAQAAFRAWRSAWPHGFRDRGEAVRLPLRRAEGTRWRVSNALCLSSCSTCTRASTAIPRSTRRCSCATTPCSAPRNCRSFVEDQFLGASEGSRTELFQQGNEDTQNGVEIERLDLHRREDA